MTRVQWEWGAVEVGLETCQGSKVTEVLLEHCKNFGFYSEGYEESLRNSCKQRIDSFFGEGNGNPLQYSYLENSMDRGAW